MCLAASASLSGQPPLVKKSLRLSASGAPPEPRVIRLDQTNPCTEPHDYTRVYPIFQRGQNTIDTVCAKESLNLVPLRNNRNLDGTSGL